MRVWHGWALMLALVAISGAYMRGLVDGLTMAGHADVVGWTWWWYAAFLAALFMGYVAHSIWVLRKA